MPYFQITIKMRDGSARNGIRHFLIEDLKQIRQLITIKTEAVTGEHSVAEVDLIELDVFDSRVVEFILTNKEQVKRPRPTRPE